jgi:hypothetical protein
MQLAAPQPRRHKVLMSFRYWNAWDVIFFDTDRMRTALPRRARFNSDEALIEFAQRAGGIKMSEDRQILDMMIQRKTGEITLNLTRRAVHQTQEVTFPHADRSFSPSQSLEP